MDNFVPAPPPLPMPTAADPFGERAKAAWAPAQKPANQRPAATVALEALENRVVELEQSIVELLSRVQPVLTPLAPVGTQQPMPPVPTPAPPLRPVRQRRQHRVVGGADHQNRERRYQARGGVTMRIGRLTITASRFPWQGYGWFPHKSGNGPRAPLNSSGARFGAGWKYKLGVSVGGTTVMFDVLFGIISVRLEKRHD